MIRAVVFDMDGVLISSEELWDAVREALSAELGGTWSPGAHRDMMGMNTGEWSGYMHDVLGVPLAPAEIAREVSERLLARYRATTPYIPGAAEVVRQVAGRHPLGLASSSTRVLIDGVLDQMGIAACFRVTVSSEEVDRGKPAPDVYLEALARLGVDPADAVAVEDTGGGIRAASAAGMHVLAIPNPHYPPAPEALALADTVLDSITDLPGAIPG